MQNVYFSKCPKTLTLNSIHTLKNLKLKLLFDFFIFLRHFLHI